MLLKLNSAFPEGYSDRQATFLKAAIKYSLIKKMIIKNNFKSSRWSEHYGKGTAALHLVLGRLYRAQRVIQSA